MRKLNVAIVTLAAIVTAGCVKMDKTPPKDLPAYVRLYPGSQQMMNMNMGPVSSDVVTTTAAPDDVLSWYRTQAASDGLTEQAVPPKADTPATQKQAEFVDNASGRMLVVIAKPQGSETVVSLSYKTPAAKAAS
ncbi:MAG TPA: hypothetical protein VGI95_12630 [Caulobacteraceae bacterium]|jgi:hypothetical protein